MQGRALRALAALTLCLGTESSVSAQAGQASKQYVAYREGSPTTPIERDELVKNATAAGLKPVKDSALERAGLWVFEIEDAVRAAASAALFKTMERVPVNEFRGVLSVPTGRFYLRFAEGVPTATARKRIESLGFKIVTPASDSAAVLVVEGTGRAVDRSRELNRLKKLDQLVYVAPNDIPLRLPTRDQ
jgi:hypothetical protein